MNQDILFDRVKPIAYVHLKASSGTLCGQEGSKTTLVSAVTCPRCRNGNQRLRVPAPSCESVDCQWWQRDEYDMPVRVCGPRDYCPLERA
jgi:hypothetical protein